MFSDIPEISNLLALEGFLVAVDIEKAVDSVNHCFLLQILRKFGFGIDFVCWIKMILNNRESCIINGWKTTKYFKLERGTWLGYRILTYLFILGLEIFFTYAKKVLRAKVWISLNMNFYTPLMQMTLLSFSKIEIL